MSRIDRKTFWAYRLIINDSKGNPCVIGYYEDEKEAKYTLDYFQARAGAAGFNGGGVEPICILLKKEQ